MTYEIDVKKLDKLINVMLQALNEELKEIEHRLSDAVSNAENDPYAESDVEELHILKVAKKGEMKALREEIQRFI